MKVLHYFDQDTPPEPGDRAVCGEVNPIPFEPKVTGYDEERPSDRPRNTRKCPDCEMLR